VEAAGSRDAARHGAGERRAGPGPGQVRPLGAEYPLTISGGIVNFKYVPRFDTILTGTVDAKGNFKASRQLHSGRVTMTGHIADPNTLSATIVSPSCQYAFQTKN
jgi:hypothetical protein